jgi:hypothetical protein
LIITGKERGQVWDDFTTGDGGVHPTGKTFLQWYEDWLDAGNARGPTASGLGSPAHPLAGPEGERRPNIAHEEAVRQLRALPWWKRWFTPGPKQS